MKDFLKKSRSLGHVPRLIALALFVGSNTPVAAQTLYISKLATYAAPEKIREKVRTECMPEVQLPIVMREEILKGTSNHQVVSTDDLSAVKNELAIDLLILSLNIPPSAGWTTEKRSMKVKSVVYRNGTMVAEYVRYADNQGGGKSFLNRSACQIVERLARDIGAHTAKWLKAKKFLQDGPSTAPESEVMQ